MNYLNLLSYVLNDVMFFSSFQTKTVVDNQLAVGQILKNFVLSTDEVKRVHKGGFTPPPRNF